MHGEGEHKHLGSASAHGKGAKWNAHARAPSSVSSVWGQVSPVTGRGHAHGACALIPSVPHCRKVICRGLLGRRPSNWLPSGSAVSKLLNLERANGRPLKCPHGSVPLGESLLSWSLSTWPKKKQRPRHSRGAVGGDCGTPPTHRFPARYWLSLTAFLPAGAQIWILGTSLTPWQSSCHVSRHLHVLPCLLPAAADGGDQAWDSALGALSSPVGLGLLLACG